MSESNKSYDALKEILLADELREQKELHEQIRSLQEEIKVRQKMEHNVGPIIDEKIEELKRNFPEHFGEAMTRAIKQQINESKEEMVEALYPIIGKLIKKYIQKEMEALVDRIDQSMNKTFRFGLKSKKERTDQRNVVIKEAMPAQLNDVFVIENDSGQLLGSYSKYSVVDKDMIAAMLAAIKSFVEQAFKNKNQNLEWIEYETYKVYLITFRRLSIACTIAGVPDRKYKTELEDQVLEFTKDILPNLKPDDKAFNKKFIEKSLENHFQYL